MSFDFASLDYTIGQDYSAKTAHDMEATARLFAGIRALAPDITARAAEIEAGRRIPRDMVEALRAIGVFRMFAPRSHGGLELNLAAGLEVLLALARIDGSVGWTAMIGSIGSLFAPSLPRETYDRMYESGPDVIFAGSLPPVGIAEATGAGWRVNGRWPFASGCVHADWLVGFCVMIENGKPLPGEGGRPLVRGVFLPARDWHIEDTWYAAGLKGTGSHHIALRDAMVSTANMLDFEGGTACVPGPLYQTPPHFLALAHGATDLGTAEGALDDLLELANTGRQQFRAATPMRDSETFQFELGRIAADLRAARALHQVQVASHWRHALAGTLRDETLLAQGTQAGIWIATTCVRVADACFTLAGGSAVYESSPLQRRMRDLHVAAQHGTIQQRHYVAAGRAAIEQYRRPFEDLPRLAAE